ncbi:MAG TPA: hypothetical protein ENG42_01455 [Candidatus Aenigmarchaeota archaeon]|nr:MAG: hypothetical protein DRP03_00555 [Candidatus Aenigmarchaeota archaeon]HDD46116.1 hypothetical protein [Candidatus Aenigmarchaeota archaeon]
MDVMSEKVVSFLYAKKILEKREKKKELGYEQKNALEHLRKFCTLTEEQENKIRDELKAMGKLNEEQIVNIVNFLPTTIDQVNIIFAYERTILEEEEKKKIIEIVKNVVG